MPFLSRIKRGLFRRWQHFKTNQRLRLTNMQVGANAPKAVKKPVIFFNASTRLSGLSLNSAFSLLTSWALRLQGVPVIHFVCRAALSPCVLGTNQNNPQNPPPCRECIRQSEAAYHHTTVEWLRPGQHPKLEASLQGLDTNQLTQFTHQGMSLGELILPSLRWILRCYHIPDDNKTRWLFRRYIISAWQASQQFAALCDEVRPQAVVLFNGMFYPEAAVRWTARQQGIKCITHEVNLRPFSAYFTTKEATIRSIDIPEGFQLDQKQEAQLDTYLEERFKGNFAMAGIRFWPEMRGLDEVFLERAASFKKIVPVFTNVIFDTSQEHANTVFPHMFAWLEMVLEIIGKHPDTLFVIRSHPDESRPGKTSRESVAQWVKDNQVDEIPNVLFVTPDEHISSYELIKRSSFVMTYNSTIGLEAVLLNVAALVAGKAHYTQMPTVYFPDTPQAFRRQAESFLQSGKVSLPPEYRRNARRFLYYQLFLSALTFEDYIEDDGIWKGYVKLKPFSWQALMPDNSPTMQTITDGILNDKPFLMPKDKVIQEHTGKNRGTGAA